MKILIANTYHYMRGGDSRHAFGLSNLMKSKGHDVVHFAMHHRKNIESEYSRYFVSEVDYMQMNNNRSLASVFKVISRSIYSTEARHKIERLVLDTKPDLGHLQNIRLHLTPSIIFGLKKLGIPVVWTLHDYDVICPNSLFLCKGRICEKCMGYRYYNAVLNKCKKDSFAASFMACIESYAQKVLGIYDMVDKVITPSAFLMKKLVECGLDGNKIVNIPNFIGVDEIKPMFENKGYFLYFGRLSEEKGIKVLIEAMHGIVDSKLLVVGEGPIRNDLKDYVKKSGLDNIEFIGFMTGESLKEIVKNAMFVVMPSIWYENFPYAILESFAAGKPVIASRIGGIPELIEDEVNGLLFELGNVLELRDKILSLLKDSEKVKRYGRAAAEKVRNEFNSSVHYDRTLKIYEQLI